MKIRHFSRKDLPEIRKRLQLIISLSHQNRLDSNYAITYELLAEDLPHARKFNLDLAKSVRERIKEVETKIDNHKKWIEQKAPGFFRRISFVRDHIVTWDLDLPAIRYPMQRSEPLPRKTHTCSTLLERKQSLARRRQIMGQWYHFFFQENLQGKCIFYDPN